jgi:hypothetical protein
LIRPAVLVALAGADRARRRSAPDQDVECVAQINLFWNKYPWPSPAPEIEPPLIVVVRAASQLDQVDTRFAAKRAGVRVVELYETALVAPMAVRTDIAATPEVTHPDRTLNRGRGDVGHGLHRPRDTRLLGGRELLLRELLEQGFEGTVENDSVVTCRDGMAERVFGEPHFSSVSPLMVTWSL